MIRYILPDYLVFEYTMVESSILKWETILLIRMVIVEFTTLVYDTMFGIKLPKTLNPQPSNVPLLQDLSHELQASSGSAACEVRAANAVGTGRWERNLSLGLLGFRV